MSAQAALCPHCGARQSSTPDLLEGHSEADERLEAYRRNPKRHEGTTEDAKAILATTDFADGTGTTVGGLFRRAWRPVTRGGVRAIERTLTIVAFPLVTIGIFFVWWVRASHVENFMEVDIGPISAAVGSLCASATLVYVTSGASRLAVAAMTAAWALRGVVRIMFGPQKV